MSTWLDTSETVAGLVIKHRVSPTSVRPEIFEYPYNKIIQDLKDGKSPEEIYLNYSEAYDTALLAVERINGSHEIDWIELLEKSRVVHDTGQKLSRISGKMLDGESFDLASIREIINVLGEGRTGRVPLNQIEPMEVPVIETGWKVYDEHLGGVPAVGLIIVSGAPSSGKTTWATILARNFALKHKDKIVGFYSLEMMQTEIALRFKETGATGQYRERLHINCDPLNVDEVINDAAKIENLGLVIIDFADYMIRGKIDDSSMGEIYTKCAISAKQLNCPVVLLAQYSYKYAGGIPRPYHIRYTSLAQILGWMLVCLWNPHRSFYEEDKKALESDFPLREKTPNGNTQAAAFIWKFRGGYRKHPMDNPGAIIHEFNGRKGWSPTGTWRHIRNY